MRNENELNNVIGIRWEIYKVCKMREYFFNRLAWIRNKENETDHVVGQINVEDISTKYQ